MQFLQKKCRSRIIIYAIHRIRPPCLRRTLFLQGFDPLPTQRVPPLYYFEISIIGDEPFKFSKYILVSGGGGGGHTPKKRNFLVRIFQKVPKNAFLAGFFFQVRTKQCFGRARKISLVNLKRSRQNFRKFFENQSPPLEKILDPPL